VHAECLHTRGALRRNHVRLSQYRRTWPRVRRIANAHLPRCCVRLAATERNCNRPLDDWRCRCRSIARRRRSGVLHRPGPGQLQGVRDRRRLYGQKSSNRLLRNPSRPRREQGIIGRVRRMRVRVGPALPRVRMCCDGDDDGRRKDGDRSLEGDCALSGIDECRGWNELPDDRVERHGRLRDGRGLPADRHLRLSEHAGVHGPGTVLPVTGTHMQGVFARLRMRRNRGQRGVQRASNRIRDEAAATYRSMRGRGIERHPCMRARALVREDSVHARESTASVHEYPGTRPVVPGYSCMGAAVLVHRATASLHAYRGTRVPVPRQPRIDARRRRTSAQKEGPKTLDDSPPYALSSKNRHASWQKRVSRVLPFKGRRGGRQPRTGVGVRPQRPPPERRKKR
jgi:hypothetical protein